MTAARAVLAFLWLLMATAAPLHAAQASEPPCHAMAAGHHKPMPVSPDAAMPCCSQPALPATPEMTVPHVCSESPVGLASVATRLPSGLFPETAPRPPRFL